ncbi:Dickkopf N-terminal cysteine-rich domain-containing protein [Rhizobium esperanzae]|uniref:Dickkopf N-terminal cysteine-rich domain-containing protein n=1 Tax=Rhizobium esperanzae TaxID=1967781 RepID=UPI003917D889
MAIAPGRDGVGNIGRAAFCKRRWRQKRACGTCRRAACVRRTDCGAGMRCVLGGDWRLVRTVRIEGR